jgi:hypothetical protein
LILVAAALFKLHVGSEIGARRLAARGLERIETAARHHAEWRGLRLEPVAESVRDRLLRAGAPLALEHAAFELALGER